MCDSVIAHGTIPNPVSLKANSKTGINVPITVPYNFPASISRAMGKDRDIDYECEFGVVIQIPIFGRFTLPVSKKGTVKMPTWSEMYREAVGGT